MKAIDFRDNEYFNKPENEDEKLLELLKKHLKIKLENDRNFVGIQLLFKGKIVCSDSILLKNNGEMTGRAKFLHEKDKE